MVNTDKKVSAFIIVLVAIVIVVVMVKQGPCCRERAREIVSLSGGSS
jgi:t-SNARE complex subunit (syntaxin)